MRLLHCQLQNVRVHRKLDLNFSPRLTVIGGANESGKSTLVEALHRALFLKASSTGAAIEALQSRQHLGMPTVELGFEARGEQWLLRKRFSGSSGQVSLQDCSGGSGSIQGPAAEDQLAQLLGVDAILSSRQANKGLPGRWAHLWVMQGLAGDNPLSTNRYDLQGLLEQLERSGGAVVQQSRLDQQVSEAIEQALAEQFTTRGVKRHSPLWQREQANQAAESRLENAKKQLKEFDEATTELTKLSQELHHIQNTLLPQLIEQQADQQKQLEQISVLKTQQDLATKAIEPIRLRYQRVSERIKQQQTLQQEIEQRRQRLDLLTTRLASVSPKQQNLETSLKDLTESRQQGENTLQKVETSIQDLQNWIQHQRLEHDAARNQADLDQSNNLATRYQQLSRERDGLPAISQLQLDELRNLDQQIREATIRCSAMAAGLTLLTTDQDVSLNGQPLAVAHEQIIDEPSTLQIGDGVQLSIKPNGGQALDTLKRSIETKQTRLKQTLKTLNLKDLNAAETALSERHRLTQALQAISPPSTEQLNILEQRKQTLQTQIAELPKPKQRDAQVTEQSDPDQLRQRLEIRMQEQQTLRTTLRSIATRLEQTRQEQQQHQREQQNAETESKLLLTDLKQRQQALMSLVEQHGKLDQQHQEQREQNDALNTAEQTLNKLKHQLAEVSPKRLQEQTSKTDRQLKSLQDRRDDLIDQRGRAKERCDRISATDPYDALADAEAKAITTRDDLDELRMRINAQKLLQDLFQSAQNDLSQRYSQPLSDAVNDLLKPVIGQQSTSRLSFQQNSGFQGLQLCRGNGVYDFGELSGGMREQLSAAVRLAMADVLRPGHDGCLPLIFDDAFTNSDPERVQGLKSMLERAVDRGLQIILLSCDATPYETIADRIEHLPGLKEDG